MKTMLTKKNKSFLLGVFISIIWIIGIVLVWELISYYLLEIAKDGMATKKLPYLHDIISNFFAKSDTFLTDMSTTFSRAIEGFIWGAAVGFLLAILLSLTKFFEKMIFPYLLISQMIPILGLAPIVYAIVRDIDKSRVIIAAFITFFPVSTNFLAGLKAVDIEKKNLLYSYAAKKHVIYFKLMLPDSLPYLFSGLKIAAPMSVTASILVDTLGGASGVGYRILNSLYNGFRLDFWVALVMGAFMGIISYLIVILLEKLSMPWKRREELRGGK